MNSDPYDSAAWRTFGMLDADESATFDDAMRHDPVLRGAYLEMDRLSAAIAAATTAPVKPQAGQLERLQARIQLNHPRRGHLWLGISGWAAALVLGGFLVLEKTGAISQPAVESAAAPGAVPDSPAPPENPPVAPVPVVPAPTHEKDAAVAAAPAPETEKEQERKATTKVETKRLVQEIEVLRENLEKFQHRDRVLFEAVPGMALPIVMRMYPPGVTSEDPLNIANNDEHSPIASMLGDALKGMTATSAGTPDEGTEGAELLPPGDDALLPVLPTGIPIYDAARDVGTFVVQNLPPAEVGKVYNLWVTTATGENPIYVGSLPESSASGADSFDFSLGSNMVLPSGFVLTKDRHDKPTSPTRSNTVLQGPPTPLR